MPHPISFSSPAVPGPVLFFDGECGLCQRVVHMLLRLDRKGILRFAPLQSPTAQRYLQAHGLPTADFDSLVFVPDWTRQAEAEFLLRTDGALAAARAVGGMGTAMAWLRILPRSWRDLAYKAISRWRYRIFGEWKSAPLSQGEWAARFLA